MATGETSYPIIGSSYDPSNIVEKLFSAYDSVCTAEEKISSVEKSIVDAFPDKFNMCDIDSFTSKLTNILSTLTEVKNAVTISISNTMSYTNQDDQNNTDITNEENVQIRIDVEYTKYVATQIILKKYQILQYKIEKLKKNVQVIEAKITKTVLESILIGKGSATNPMLAAPMVALQTVAQVVSKIMTVINFVLKFITIVPIMSIDADGMCFFMTPKSLKTTKMKILNANESINNTIPDSVSKAITKAQQKINELNGKLKKEKVAEMAAAGASSAESGSGFDPGEFGSLERFDQKEITAATTAILNTLLDAEPIPRYERLKITNTRFLYWLITGFVPAGNKSFGIPGFP